MIFSPLTFRYFVILSTVMDFSDTDKKQKPAISHTVFYTLATRKPKMSLSFLFLITVYFALLMNIFMAQFEPCKHIHETGYIISHL